MRTNATVLWKTISTNIGRSRPIPRMACVVGGGCPKRGYKLDGGIKIFKDGSWQRVLMASQTQIRLRQGGHSQRNSFYQARPGYETLAVAVQTVLHRVLHHRRRHPSVGLYPLERRQESSDGRSPLGVLPHQAHLRRTGVLFRQPQAAAVGRHDDAQHAQAEPTAPDQRGRAVFHGGVPRAALVDRHERAHCQDQVPDHLLRDPPNPSGKEAGVRPREDLRGARQHGRSASLHQVGDQHKKAVVLCFPPMR